VTTVILPEYVIPCGWCNGRGEYEQTYTAGCGGGYYRSLGPCDHCRQEGKSSYNGVGYVYRDDERYTRKGVPDSVLAQIRGLNE
jgi:hypothetical protein